MAINDIGSIFSQNTTAAKKKLDEVEAAKPGQYQSNWSGTINSLMDKIVNQKDFSYDFNADPLYQQYKDNYTQLGKQAAMDTQANAATLTGGFGNSYAVTAATQANQQYLTQLNNVIPQLYSLAMDKYRMDTDRLYNQFNAVGTQEDRDYGQYRDLVGDWQTDRNYYYGKYNDSVGNDQFVANYNQAEDQFNQNMAYNKERDRIADQQWQQQVDYQKQRDNVSDAQWEKQYALSVAKSKSSGGGSKAKSSSKTSSSNKSGTKKKDSIDKENEQLYTFHQLAEKLPTDYNGDVKLNSLNSYLNNEMAHGRISEKFAKLVYETEANKRK